MTIDPLLQPNQRKHLRLKNRVMTSAHEPALLPKEYASSLAAEA